MENYNVKELAYRFFGALMKKYNHELQDNVAPQDKLLINVSTISKQLNLTNEQVNEVIKYMENNNFFNNKVKYLPFISAFEFSDNNSNTL